MRNIQQHCDRSVFARRDKSGNSHHACSAGWQMPGWKEKRRAMMPQSRPARREKSGSPHHACSAGRQRPRWTKEQCTTVPLQIKVEVCPVGVSLRVRVARRPHRALRVNGTRNFRYEPVQKYRLRRPHWNFERHGLEMGSALNISKD